MGPVLLCVAAVAGIAVGCSGGGAPQALASTPTSASPSHSSQVGSGVIPIPTQLPANLSRDDAMRLFQYDPAQLAGVRDDFMYEQDGASVHAINYVMANGGSGRADLVLPAGKGPFGAVVWFPGGFGNRDEMMPDALVLAQHGIAGLLIGYPELYAYPTTDQEAVTNMIFEVRELRKLVDWLATRSDIDPARIGLYGVSYGAVRATMFAGVEGGRVKITVVNSTPSTFGSPAMAPFDPITWIGRASPGAFYLQEGTQDPWFTLTDAEALIAAAREPKRLVWYEAGHGLNQQAYEDEINWFVEALGSST